MKKISFSGQGRRADIGEMTIYRILPNRYADAVGPFVFLDHLAPVKYEPGLNELSLPNIRITRRQLSGSNLTNY